MKPVARAATAARPTLAALGVLALLASATAAAAPAGDAGRGAAAYEARCGGCHAVETDRIGPRHAGVLGRRAGSVPGFEYSPALKRSRLVWDLLLLERWLADPEALVPGQRMGYRVGDAQLRADLVAYLASLKPRP